MRTRPAGLGNSLLRSVITAPFGPASTFSTLAVPAERLDQDHLEQRLHLLGQRPEAVDQFGARRVDLARIGRGRPAGGRAACGPAGRARSARGSSPACRARSAGSTRPSPRSRRRRRGARPPPPRASPGRARSRPRGCGPTAPRPAGCRRRGCRGRGWRAGSRRRGVSSDCSTVRRRSAVSLSLRSGGHGEQRIGALLGAADAAADLVELREAEIVGAMHHQACWRWGCRDRIRRSWSTPARRTCRRRSCS